jgi:hypothetical protein
MVLYTNVYSTVYEALSNFAFNANRVYSPNDAPHCDQRQLAENDETGCKVKSTKWSDLFLRERQPSQGIPTLGGVSDAMWTGCKLRRLLAGEGGGSGGTDAGGEEVG